MAIRVGNEADKEALIASDPTKFFTEPHYQSFPAILVCLAQIDLDELGELLEDAWRIQAPRTWCGGSKPTHKLPTGEALD